MAREPQMCGGYPRQQRRAIELHDSKVRAAVRDERAVRVRLSAYVHVSTGVPGVDAGTGWSQELELVIGAGSIERATFEDALWILDGSLEVDGERFELLPFSLERAGRVRLDLNGAEGALSLTGSSIAIEPLEEPQFVERVAGRARGGT